MELVTFYITLDSYDVEVLQHTDGEFCYKFKCKCGIEHIAKPFCFFSCKACGAVFKLV